MMVSSLADEPVALFLSWGVAILAGSFLTLSVLFVPKIMVLSKDEVTDSSLQLSTTMPYKAGTSQRSMDKS